MKFLMTDNEQGENRAGFIRLENILIVVILYNIELFNCIVKPLNERVNTCTRDFIRLAKAAKISKRF